MKRVGISVEFLQQMSQDKSQHFHPNNLTLLLNEAYCTYDWMHFHLEVFVKYGAVLINKLVLEPVQTSGFLSMFHRSACNVIVQ